MLYDPFPLPLPMVPLSEKGGKHFAYRWTNECNENTYRTFRVNDTFTAYFRQISQKLKRKEPDLVHFWWDKVPCAYRYLVYGLCQNCFHQKHILIVYVTIMDLTFASVHITHTNDMKNVKSTTWCKAVILQPMYNQNLLFGYLSQCIAH